jgi:hypothetical protein
MKEVVGAQRTSQEAFVYQRHIPEQEFSLSLYLIKGLMKEVSAL